MSSTQDDPPAGQPGPPRCYRHPNREALVRCTRCDRPICPECMREASVGFHCPDDVAIARKTVAPQRNAIGAVLRQSPPVVTGALIVLNLIAYVVTAVQSPAGLVHPIAAPINSLFYDWQLQPRVVLSDGSYWRLITSAFLHVSPLHIGANMFTLAIIGPPLERLLGPARFLAVYTLALLGGSTAIYAFGAADTPVVGASGAIFGLFGACLILVRRLGLDPQWLIGVIVLNFVFTFSVNGISRLGHLGGFLTGVVAGVAIAGLPNLNRRVAGRRQASGLAGLGAALILTVVVRSAVGGF